MTNELTAGLIGLIVGSFVNVVVFRLPDLLRVEVQSVWAVLKGLSFPGSSCPCCAKRLVWWENVPVVSYVILRGKCRTCGYAIPIQYVGIELLVCFEYLALAIIGQWSVFPIFLITALTILAFLDLEHRLLPDLLTLPLLAVGILGAALSEGRSVAGACAAAAMAFGYFVLVCFASKRIAGRDALGGGDAKLAAALGAWFGVAGGGMIVFLSGIISLVIALARRVDGKEGVCEKFPFGTALCAVAVGAFFLSVSLRDVGSLWPAFTGSVF